VRLSRRQFVAWMTGAVPVVLVTRRADFWAGAWIADDAETLRALAEAILPSQLGAAGAARVAHDFQHWIDGYRERAELVHGYGTSVLRFSGPSPRARWAAQLEALRTGRFARLSLEQRRSAVAAELASIQGDRLPDVATAPHVALALLSFYFSSAEAADLCHESRIGREQCRPLAASSRKPLPLAGPRA